MPTKKLSQTSNEGIIRIDLGPIAALSGWVRVIGGLGPAFQTALTFTELREFRTEIETVTHKDCEPVLVVIADAQLRYRVRLVLNELDLSYIDAANWRQALVRITLPPKLLIVDLDDIRPRLAGLVALLRSGWAEPVQFIGLCSETIDTHLKEELGDSIVLGKPVDLRLLMVTLAEMAGRSESET